MTQNSQLGTLAQLVTVNTAANSVQFSSGFSVGNASVNVVHSSTGFIVNGVNGWLVPSGTIHTFQQSAAPTGWTKVTTYHDYAMRIVSGSVGNGGSVAFSSAFSSQSVSGSISSVSVTGTSDGHTLSTSEIPSHLHGGGGYETIHIRGSLGGYSNGPQAASGGDGFAGWYDIGAGGGGAHSHTFTATSHNHTFTGTNINMAVNYIDFILFIE